MAPTLIIVFREVFEIVLVLSILMAATRGIAGRGWWIASGTGTGVLGAGLVALFAQAIAEAAAGAGQEVFNASVLFCAVVMLGWHNVWMARHGGALALETDAAAARIRQNERPVWALAIIAAVATVREGAEIVLFLNGIAVSQPTGQVGMLTGGIAGLGLGVLVGVALYFGLVRLSGRMLFTVTSWMILFLAAGMASEGAKFLVQGGLIDGLGGPLWDTSFILSDGSAVGRVLHTLIGYSARPTPVQLLFYVVTLIAIGGFMKLPTKRRMVAGLVSLAVVSGGVATLVIFAAPDRANAAPVRVCSPIAGPPADQAVSARRSTLPTGLLGSASTNSMTCGTL